jgi:hypothetical protein
MEALMSFSIDVPKSYLDMLFVLLFLPTLLFAQGTMKWKAHDMDRPRPKIITPPENYLPVSPPSDALVLFNGKDLSAWEDMEGKKTKWICRDDYFECVKGSGFIRTKQGFGDVQLHIEWAAPVPAKGHSQGRGNSGVFLMGHYEVQVLDSYDNITYADGQAAAIYGQYPPQVNAARPPGEWQSYDIVFHRPRFNNLGVLEKPATMTIFHNGVLVQDNVAIWGGTNWQRYTPYSYHPDKLPLSLQDHGNPVRFRNVWIRELSEQPEQAPNYPPAITLSANDMQKYTGTYEDKNGEKYQIVLEGETLYLLRPTNRKDELIIYSRDRFALRYTAIELHFQLGENGIPNEMTLTFTGESFKFKKIE